MDDLTDQVARIVDPVAYSMTPAAYGLKTEEELMRLTFAGGARMVAMERAEKIIQLVRSCG